MRPSSTDVPLVLEIFLSWQLVVDDRDKRKSLNVATIKVFVAVNLVGTKRGMGN
jgi:hypothetical protein